MYKRGRIGINLGQKKGQLTMFIIIALVIVGVGVLIYFLSPDLRTDDPGFDETNPEAFMQTCLEDDLRDTVEIISLQGGSMEPEFYFTFNGVNVEYLCYVHTNEDPKTCNIQQPLLRQSMESEIENEIRNPVISCFESLEASYEERGYQVNLDSGITRVNILPNRVIVNMNYILTVTRADTERFEDFNVIMNSNLHQLLDITNSIIEWESTLGEADPRTYMDIYHHIRVSQNLRGDGTMIYTVEDKNTGDKFEFASRSLVFPAGH